MSRPCIFYGRPTHCRNILFLGLLLDRMIHIYQ
nr:MAG TPA: PROTEIN Z-DEPENDENT PROTEASE INHIBITOR CLOTTING, SERPIN, PROTEIN Z [Bacteriophage sp.]